ncbi:MAG: MFS transporter [Desulfamplus sp.]|nr:MFS transporter [Desulfamplus sp.]
MDVNNPEINTVKSKLFVPEEFKPAGTKRDIALLFTTRIIRLFAYGFLSVVMVLYLSEIGLKDHEIGLLLSLTLTGDVGVSLWVTTFADRMGRKRMLISGAILMVLAGMVFVFTKNPIFLTIAAIIGIISPTGNEIGPFLSIEQAVLSQLVDDHKRTSVFGWYNLAGSFATATGALCSGWMAALLEQSTFAPVEAYRIILICYALSGFLLILFFAGLSPAVEVSGIHEVEAANMPDAASACSQADHAGNNRLTIYGMGLHRSRSIVIKLSALFALDAFAGGFIVQSMMAYWFHIKFGIDTGILGSILFGANIFAGISALLAVRIAKHIGLVKTMVFTHIPSNILLCAIPLMPNLESAIVVLLLRASISQMDVPTRQSYTMAVVAPDERTAASGITNIARSVGASCSPVLTGFLIANPLLFSMPFFLAGGLKIIYDLSLYHMFQSIKPPEESS